MIWLAAVSVGLLNTASFSPESTGENFFLSCALFAQQDSPKNVKPNELDFLVNSKANQKGDMAVIDTYDPGRILHSGSFQTAFFSKADKTALSALTGQASDPSTQMLMLRLRAPGEYDAMLGQRQIRSGTVYKGRCWLSNGANADEEFRKLKTMSVSK